MLRDDQTKFHTTFSRLQCPFPRHLPRVPIPCILMNAHVECKRRGLFIYCYVFTLNAPRQQFSGRKRK